MVGKYTVQILSKKLSYSFVIKRKITILRGDSGSGKTSLIYMLQNSRIPKSPFTVICEKECIGISATTLLNTSDIRNIHDSIVFVDEDFYFMRTKEFAKIVKESDCYFVLISRESLRTLPYSYKEIYEIKSNKVKSSYNSIFSNSHVFDISVGKDKLSLTGILSLIIIEDSNSGFEFFSILAKKLGIKCIPAGGNSNVVKVYKNELKYNQTGILIIADGAAFGAYYAEVKAVIKSFYNTLIFLPESFEYLILQSGIVHDELLEDKIERTYDFAESKEYFSWEAYYTDLLVSLTKDNVFTYSKNHLNAMYLTKGVRDKILMRIPDRTGLKGD